MLEDGWSSREMGLSWEVGGKQVRNLLVRYNLKY
jgi:hypothetical protein